MNCMEKMWHDARYMNAGRMMAYFDDAMYCIGRIATTEMVDDKVHDVINPELDEMIKRLHTLKENVLCAMMTDGEVKE